MTNSAAPGGAFQVERLGSPATALKQGYTEFLTKERERAETLKTAILDALSQAGVPSVHLSFDVGGDSGNLCYAGCPPGHELPAHLPLIESDGTSVQVEAWQALEVLAFKLMIIGGYGGASYGDITSGSVQIEVDSRTVQLNYPEY